MNNSNQNLEEVLNDLDGLTFEVYMMANDKGALYLEPNPQLNKQLNNKENTSRYSFSLKDLINLNPLPNESYIVTINIESMEDHYIVKLSFKLQNANEDNGEFPTLFNGIYYLNKNKPYSIITGELENLIYFLHNLKELDNQNQYGVIKFSSNVRF